MESLDKVVSHFAIRGDIVSIKPKGNGHINKTYKVVTSKSVYVLQKINNHVFNNIHDLMNNITIVTEHLKDKGIFTLMFSPTLTGKLYYNGEDGYYRLYRYVGDCESYEGVNDLKVIEKAGRGFGKFHLDLSDLDTNLLVEVIPDFHNTVKRYNDLLLSVHEDKYRRARECKDLIEYAQSQEDKISMIIDAIESREVPIKITHNDPKINNVLFEKETGKVKVIIDLDTVMPGTILNDIGDAIRSLYTGDNEDNKDLSTIKYNPDIYKAFIKGYLKEGKLALNKREKELLPYAPYILSIELGFRFLKDYLDGDIYFSTSKAKHNLYRARTQFKLAKEFDEHMNELIKITKDLLK